MSSAPHEAHPATAHEETDINLRPVVIAGVALMVVLVVTAAAMFGLFQVMEIQEARMSPPPNPLAAAEGPRVPPQPRLQADPIKDLHELRKAEKDILTSYGWVDQSAGTVRIPVARAMELLAQRAGTTGAAQP